MPERADLRERLDAVLEAIYAAFAEGWSDPAGTEARRRDLAEEAIWLGRLVASLLPDEPEALGLLALMLHAEARRGARRDAAGDYVPLAEQDPALWDAALIDEAEALLLAREPHGQPSAAISSRRRCSRPTSMRRAHRPRRTGRRSRMLYDALAAITGSPVVAINRAIAIAETDGPARGARGARPRSKAMRGLRSTSPIGRRARRCSPRRATSRRPTPPTSRRSASKPTRRCGASCSSGARGCGETDAQTLTHPSPLRGGWEGIPTLTTRVVKRGLIESRTSPDPPRRRG